MKNKLFLSLIILTLVMAGIFMFLKSKNFKQLKVISSDFSGSVKTFVVNGSSFKYDPSLITVNKGDMVKIIFKDIDGSHNLIVDKYGISSKILSSGGEEVLEFIADKSGTFDYYCSLPGHKIQGMVGTFIVEN